MGFGTVLFDHGNDGDLDLLVANGHIIDNIALFDSTRSHRQPVQLSDDQAFEVDTGFTGDDQRDPSGYEFGLADIRTEDIGPAPGPARRPFKLLIGHRRPSQRTSTAEAFFSGAQSGPVVVPRGLLVR